MFSKTKNKREKERNSFLIEFARYVDDKWNDSIVIKFSYKVIAGIVYMEYWDQSCSQSHFPLVDIFRFNTPCAFYDIHQQIDRLWIIKILVSRRHVTLQ